MKNIITILFFVCIGNTCIAQGNPIRINTSFTGFHCDGKHGICDIDQANNRSQSNAEIILNEDGTLTLKIERSKLSENNLKSIIETSSLSTNTSKQYFFVVEEVFMIPISVANALDQGNHPLQIKKGNYPIFVTNNHLSLTFTIE
jgi:hypothetical protein